MLRKRVKFNNFAKAQFDIDLSKISLTHIRALYVIFALVDYINHFCRRKKTPLTIA